MTEFANTAADIFTTMKMNAIERPWRGEQVYMTEMCARRGQMTGRLVPGSLRQTGLKM